METDTTRPPPPPPRANRISWKKELPALLLLPVLGLLAFLGPWIVSPPDAYLPSPLFPILRHSVEKISPVTLGLLFLIGLGVGSFSKLPAWGIGLAAIALLPPAALAEGVVDPSSHNLLPFEFLFYAFCGLFAAAGAVASGLVRIVSRDAKRV